MLQIISLAYLQLPRHSMCDNLSCVGEPLRSSGTGTCIYLPYQRAAEIFSDTIREQRQNHRLSSGSQVDSL